MSCSHCQLPVPAGLIRAGEPQQFCCHGCETAYRLIHSCGLDAYYEIQEGQATIPTAWNEKFQDDSQFQEYDSEKFQALFGKMAGNIGEITFVVEGIHCAACIWLLEKLPHLVPGVIEATVNWGRRTVRVRWRTDRVSLSSIAKTLAQLGYPPHPVGREKNADLRKQENRKHLIRLGVAGAAAGNNMLIAIALYLGMFSHISDSTVLLFRWTSCVLGTLSVVWPGAVFFRGGWYALRTWTPHMDLPIALGLGAGLISGIVNTILNHGEIYFDSLSILVFVLLLGRWIQYRQQQTATDSIEMLYRLTPKTTRRVRNGVAVTIPSDLLEVGDTVEVLAGETFPGDGVVVHGKSSVDQAILTGESAAVQVGPGDDVAAGTLNCESMLQVTVQAVGLETRIGKVLELVQESAAKRPKIVELADRRGGYFVVVILILALVTLVGWLWFEPAMAVERMIALLVIACPCALALATPLAVSVGLARGANDHLLIKSGDIFQRLTDSPRPNLPKRLWLDKTGTLTWGRMLVHRWEGDREVWPAVAAVQQNSTHPIAQAMVQFVRSKCERNQWPEVQEVIQSQHGGIGGLIGGQNLWIGNRTFIVRQGISVGSHWDEIGERGLADGYSPIFVAQGSKLVAVALVGDGLRPDVKRHVEWLRREGWQVGILSGDHQAVVRQIATAIQVPNEQALGDQLPEDKVRIIEQSLPQSAVVVMVGDGVNDSAALAAASVGIAAHHSAEVSLQAAPVYLGRPGLAGVVDLLMVSQGTMRNIRRNFAFSLTYNLTAVCLAGLGFINPLGAAILMPISSLTVVGLSFWPIRRIQS
ncbi:MAG: heavy metal translocating P-type ATPase [Planctomycetaceae bacterium]|nr:heavy metal translocating P-type ATPase [Planctomycetaceae bacterium]